MFLNRINDVLSPGYMPFETGFRRLTSVQMEVAALHHLPGVTGEMVRWWLDNIQDDDDYRLWHPEKNAGMKWLGKEVGASHVGETMEVRQRFAGREWHYRIRYHEPSDFLDISRLENSGISFLYCTRYGAVDGPFWVGKGVHACRETEFGCEMRSRYWLGDTGSQSDQPDEDTLHEVIDDRFAESLLAYNIESMRHLTRFLPQRFAQSKTPDQPGD